jgi:glucokinase
VIDTRALGVDVGGTKIALGRIRLDGAWEHLATVPTSVGDGRANAVTVRSLLDAAEWTPSTPAGLSVTTTIDEHGRLRDAHDWLGWAGWTVHDVFGVDKAATIAVANDALCGALAESEIGAGESRPSTADSAMVYVTLGTGLAHTAVVDGRPLAGAHGGALFSGWSPAGLQPDGTAMPTWEELCAGPAIAGRFDGGRDARPLARAVAAGDERAMAIIDAGARHLGAYLCTLLQTYDPHLLVVGGGLADGMPSYVEKATMFARSFVRQDFVRSTPIVPAALGAESGWIGAALIADREGSAAVSPRRPR